MMRRSVGIVIVLLLSILLVIIPLSGCGSRSGTLRAVNAQETARFQAILDGVRSKYHLPALAGAVIPTNGVSVLAVSGTRQFGGNDPVRLNDNFNIGSCGKSMTATLIAILIGEGKLHYSDTLTTIFPDLATTMNPAYKAVTLEQVLTMTAGFQGFTDPNELLALPPFTGTGAETRQQFTAYLLAKSPFFTVGSYHYSNASYVIAAAIVEHMTGKDWETLIQQKVYAPVGMNDVRYGASGKINPNGEPWGHQSGDVVDIWVPVNPVFELDEPGLYPAGDQNMPIADWARYVQAHLRGLRGKSSTIPLSSAVIQSLHQGGEGVVSRGGWIHQTTAYGPASVFRGSTTTFDSLVIVLPEKDIAIAVVTNASDISKTDSVTTQAMNEIVNDVLSR